MIKILGIAILGLVSAGVLREVKPSLSVFAGVITGIVIIFSLLDEFTHLISEFRKISEIANIDGTILLSIIKIIGIGYVAEFTANLCDDYGFQNIGKKVLLGAKITIVILALPIISGIITAVASLL